MVCLAWRQSLGFVERNYMYTFSWDQTFDLSTGGYFPLPIWVELPSRVLSLEVGKIILAKSLGKVLVYLMVIGTTPIQMPIFVSYGTCTRSP